MIEIAPLSTSISTIFQDILYYFPNWKCGQEASIRLFNLLLASFFLEEDKNPSETLVQLVREHADRIIATRYYALAQDNNHGTSEAAALFIAGAWLTSVGHDDESVKRFLRCGRAGLEERVRRLVFTDGSFSQYSVNYHRLLLDTLSLVEFWRLRLQQPEFSARYYENMYFSRLEIGSKSMSYRVPQPRI